MIPSQDHYKSIARQVGAVNLLALRRSKGMSQSHLATAIGLSDRALRRYERGERELPQAARLAIIKAFKVDPLASNQLAVELGLGDTDVSPAAQSQTTKDEGFWKTMRREGQEFREQHYSPLGQLFLKIRDHAYASATMYFAAENITFSLGIPFGFEINGIDWMFLGAFAVIVLLFSSFVAELPILKVAQHVIRSIRARVAS
ncbi:helix-turn-helix domain-containing protein [Marivita sp. S0852]|uniref:helix-turn-helix domain-containing protein n=1 Tax=Marivita sp. S0852 TaxID=3373893 RepID=UPI003982D23F